MGLEVKAGEGSKRYLREGTYRVRLDTLGTARDRRGRYLYLEFQVLESSNPAVPKWTQCVHVVRLPPAGWGRAENELWNLVESAGYARDGMSLFNCLRDLKECCLTQGGVGIQVAAHLVKTRSGGTFARLNFSGCESVYSHHEDGCEDGEEGECSEYD